MRCLVVLALLIAGTAHAQEKTILRGAGATFPAPLYKKWVAEYAKADPKVAIEYRDVGSGEGQRRFLARAVDFGASDAALSDEQLASAGDARLIPTTAGLVAIVYNLPGFQGPLKLSRSTLADLLLGRIPKWNDARITSTNPEFKPPDRDVVLAVRQDGSGTTFALTNHLNAASDKWRRGGQGATTRVAWPSTAVLARGNEGVAALVKRNPWTVGYVEYGYAKRLGLSMALLENREGNFVAPSAASGAAAIAANLKEVPAHLRVFIPDPTGEESYPIVSLTWLLLRSQYADPAKSDALKRFVEWSLTAGQPFGDELGFVPLPAGLVERARAVAREVR